MAFGRTINYAGGYLPENTRVSFSGMTTGGIVREVRIDFQQEVSRMWDLGSGSVFLVAGQANGTFSFGTIASPVNLPVYTVCAPGTVSFNSSSGFCGKGRAGGGTTTGGGYTLQNVVSSSKGVQASSDSMVVIDTIGGIFLDIV